MKTYEIHYAVYPHGQAEYQAITPEAIADNIALGGGGVADWFADGAVVAPHVGYIQITGDVELLEESFRVDIVD